MPAVRTAVSVGRNGRRNNGERCRANGERNTGERSRANGTAVFTVLPATFALVLLALYFALPLSAQVAPDLHWSTLTTKHFHVNFAPGLEQTARRLAGSAERAYSSLALELHEPRGPIDITLGDNLDISNGNATVFPTNRITIWARPNVDATSLKFLDDWIDLVITHELTHIFHLDRSAGWWGVAQHIFGRNPFLFPNLYSPNWMSEGIAVYYESRLTGAGRIIGSEHAMVVRANALDGTTPALNAISGATPVFPLGEMVYAYGSLLIDYIARTEGPEKMRAFVDKSASNTIPFLLNDNARASFGIGFTQAYQQWSDSITRNAFAVAERFTSPTDLTARGWYTQRLRWLNDTTIVYGSNDGRSVSSLRELRVGSNTTMKPRRLERRNSIDITVPLSNGGTLYAQQEYTDPYTVRNDLYSELNGETRRLTTNARVMQPDARFHGIANGCTAPQCTAPGWENDLDIVAVQLSPGASGLVRVTFTTYGPVIAPLTGFNSDTIWSEPRWSHAGTRIAAVRWTRGGTSEIVILDTTGSVIGAVGRSHSVNSAPSWAPLDSAIYFTSDRSGRSALYRVSAKSHQLFRVAEVATGLSESEPSPDGSRLATLHYKGDGYHIALIKPDANREPVDSASVYPPSRQRPTVVSDAPVQPYSAFRSLLPAYWLPAAQISDENRETYGFLTSGNDVLGRHAYQIQATLEPRRLEPNIDFGYSYAGFGNPVLALSGTQEWDHFGVFDSTRKNVGVIARRRNILDLSLTFANPHVRSNSYLTIGAEHEWRDFRTDPAPLINQINNSFSKTFTYPAFFASAGYSNVRVPILAISYEDGIQLAGSVRQRWRSDAPGDTRSTSAVGVFSAFKSLDLPGFAHHVIAIRAAAGWEDNKAVTQFNAGGVSGSTLSVVPGVNIGDGRRTFFARGFPANSQYGEQAMAGSVEYRAPISLPAAGYKLLPIFLQRISATFFADAATAWCPTGSPTSAVCSTPGGTPRDWMSSAGAELNLDAALQYDYPFRCRLGAATPIAGRKYFGKNAVTAYLTAGLSF